MQDQNNPISGTQTVLLVDDDEVITDVGQEMLEIMGYRVIVAGSGEQAVKTVAEGGATIDLVILDMMMPSMDGGQTFDEIRKIRPDLPVILSSGYGIDGEAEAILSRGCNGFIQKPYNFQELTKKIKEILASLR